MDLRVLMPLTRFHHVDLYLDCFRDQGITWHPVHSLGKWAVKVEEKEEKSGSLLDPFPKRVRTERVVWAECQTRLPDEPWIKPFVVDNEVVPHEACCGGPDGQRGSEPYWTGAGGVMPVWWKLNKFIEYMPKPMTADGKGAWDDAYFWLLADDCWPGADFFRNMKEWFKASFEDLPPSARVPTALSKPECLVIEQRRSGLSGLGGKIDPVSHKPLAFAWDLSMLIVRGDVLRKQRFRERLWFADTFLVEEMASAGIKFVAVPGSSNIDKGGKGCWMYYNGLTPSEWGCTVTEGIGQKRS